MDYTPQLALKKDTDTTERLDATQHFQVNARVSKKEREAVKSRSVKNENISVKSVEEIELGDSDEYEDDGSDDDGVQLWNETSHRSTVRAVVTPRPFHMNGSLTLKKFFEMFEKYFRTKYEGGERECSIELANFLLGEILDAYEAFDGANKRYSKVKEKLLEWYKSQGAAGSKRWRNELSVVIMKPGESFKLFGIRVQELASKAHPQNERDCARAMQSSYLNAVPQGFLAKLQQRVEMKEIMGLNTRMTWNDIMKLAESEDKASKRSTAIEVPKRESLVPEVWFTLAQVNRCEDDL